eukprot:scaffold1318_cov388-Prasinococcus_capsulatus_cf.AAC.83
MNYRLLGKPANEFGLGGFFSPLPTTSMLQSSSRSVLSLSCFVQSSREQPSFGFRWSHPASLVCERGSNCAEDALHHPGKGYAHASLVDHARVLFTCWLALGRYLVVEALHPLSRQRIGGTQP